MKSNQIPMMAFFALVIVVTSCSSKDDTEDPTTNKKVRLKTEILSDTQYGTSTYLYLYDDQGRLRKIASDDSEEFFYNTDGTLNKVTYGESSSTESEIYHYKNAKIDYIERIGFNKNSNADTLFFTYKANGKLEYTKISYYFDGIVSETRTDFSFDNSDRLLTRFELNYTDNIVTRYDSTFLQWDNNGNLTEISKRQWFEGLVNSTAKIEYEYDNKLNFYNTANYPSEFLFYKSLTPGEEYSTNNYIVETETYTSGDTHTTIHNISSYSDLGYPTMINADWGTWELQYEEY